MKAFPKIPASLRNLIAKGEGLKIEVKEIPSDEVLSQISKFCASFANSNGGSIVIGVNDHREVVGANINDFS